jgi:hypothetical protein
LPGQIVAAVAWPALHDGGLHCVVELNAFVGQVGLVPLQASATSQTPAAARHCAPALPATFVHPTPAVQPSTVHGLPSLQLRAGPGWQLPAASHESPFVHTSPSLQTEPIGAGVFVQPVPEAQESAVQSLPSSQFGPPVPVQTPAWHASVTVQAFESLHGEPFALFGFEQLPFAGLQVPAL